MFSLVIQRTEALPVNADPTMLAWISAVIYGIEKERYNSSEKLKNVCTDISRHCLFGIQTNRT